MCWPYAWASRLQVPGLARAAETQTETETETDRDCKAGAGAVDVAGHGLAGIADAPVQRKNERASTLGWRKGDSRQDKEPHAG